MEHPGVHCCTMVQALVAIGQNEDENHTFKIVLYCAQGADPPPVPLSAAKEGRNFLNTGVASDIAKPYQLYA